MTVAALTGPFIQAKGYTRGRDVPVIYLGIHTAQGAKTREELGHYFAGTLKGSSNAGMDERGVDGYAEYVTYNNTPWTNPPINRQSDTLEICGFAEWTRDQWLAKPKLLDGVGHWIAWRSAVRGIPLVHRSGGVIGTGSYGHKDVNDAWHKSRHTDPGPGFPWDVVMAKAIALAKPQPAAAKAQAAAAHPFHSGLARGRHAPDIAAVRSRFRMPPAPEGADFYGEDLVSLLNRFARSRGLTPNGAEISRDLWKEIWR